MSGFFSLGPSKQDQNNNNHTSSTNSLLLFKNNEEIYNKGFELWQQYYQLQQQQQNKPSSSSPSQDVDFSAGPTSTSPSPTTNNSGFINLAGYDHQTDSTNRLRLIMMMRQGGGGRGGSSTGGSGDSINCQDCGNQAKKDCSHMRCRTCCKSRGFQCQTHVKSTWVPAAKRRERQQQQQQMVPMGLPLHAQDHQQQHHQHQQQLQLANLKRLRENPGGSGGGGGGGMTLACATTSRLPAATTSGFELGHFPAEVNSSAVFRCVKVSSMDEAEEHMAYQTAVNIGGHVFKGILYDQGPDNRYPRGGGESSSHPQHIQQQPLHLMGPSSSGGVGGTTSYQNVGMIDSSGYPTPLNAFMAGTQFFPPPRH